MSKHVIDSSGLVRVVALSADEAAEVQAYQDSGALHRVRSAAIEALDAYALSLIATDYPGVEGERDMEILRWTHTSIAPAGRSAALARAAAVVVHARARRQELRGYTTVAEIQAYDPATDTGWPP